MNANGLVRAVSLLVVIPVALTAQLARYQGPVTLKHWPAPLYWQPAQTAGEHALATPAATANVPPGANALVFVAMTPCRVVDTRTAQGFTGAFGPPSLARGVSRTFPIQSSTRCAIPTAVLAYSFNITVVPPGPLGFITAYPTGQTLPLAATVNSPQGFIVGNAAVLQAGINDSIDVFASDPTDIVIDINGYYAAPNAVSFAGSSSSNTAVGLAALQANISGTGNTAEGASALLQNTTGVQNTAIGIGTMQANIAGNFNTAVGAEALSKTTGDENVAVGLGAGEGITTGSFNTAIGPLAMGDSTQVVTGSWNIAIGGSAGINLRGGSNNIDIGSLGLPADSGIIRIGYINNVPMSGAFVDGITGVNVAGAPVVVSSSGQLGVTLSSRRYKEEIHDMGDRSANILQLRPVTFRYKQPFTGGSKSLDYGLIAEEVAEVYPDLVIKGSDGQIQTVQYQKLTPMLLNELQKEHQQVELQAETIRQLEIRLAALEQRILQ